MTTETTEGTIAKEKIVQDFKTVYSDVEELLRVTAASLHCPIPPALAV